MLWTVSDKELPGGCRPKSRVVGYNSGLILARALFLFPEHCDVAGHLSLINTAASFLLPLQCFSCAFQIVSPNNHSLYCFCLRNAANTRLTLFP